MQDTGQQRLLHVKNILLLIGAVLISLLTIETACRLFLTKKEVPPNIPRLFITKNEIYTWCQPKKYSRRVINKKTGKGEFVMLLPDLKFAHRYPSNRRGYFDKKNCIQYRNNNFGFRGRDIISEDSIRHENRRQVVLLGDSFTWGEGVYLKDTYGFLLELNLNNFFPHIPTRVINLSQPGLDTYTEFVVWEIHKNLVAPDLVIVMFNPNDIHLTKIQEQDKKRITGKYMKRFEKPKGMEKFLIQSKLYEFTRNRLLDKLMEREMYKITVKELNRTIDGQSPSDLCRIHLRQLYKSVQARGSRFMVAIVPSLVNLENSYPYHSVHKLVNNIGTEEGFHVIDLLPGFQGKKSSQFWVHPIDHHPNEIAHKLIADLLFNQAEFKKVLFELYGTRRTDPIQRAH